MKLTSINKLVKYAIPLSATALFVLCIYYFSPEAIRSKQAQLLERLQPGTWSDLLDVVEIESSIDGHKQLAYSYQSRSSGPMPLIVSLHTWSNDYSRYDELSEVALRHDFNYIHPDFRGANNHMISCSSPEALADIDDAITYCLNKWNIDPSRIYVVGASGGGHAGCSLYFNTKHKIRAIYAWAPITDLESWYYQCIDRGLKFAADIIKVCGGEFSPEVARSRSPMYMNVEEPYAIKLHLFAGINDGHEGSVPISHSMLLYNRLCSDLGFSQDQLTSQQIVSFLTRSCMLTGESIGGRGVYLNSELNNLSLTIFDGGHEILTAFQEELIVLDLKD